MNLLFVTTSDYLHHPIPSRHHAIAERLSDRGHTVHVPHFHVHHDTTPRKTHCTIHPCTRFPVHNPLLHYTLNAIHQEREMDRIIGTEDIDVVIASNVLAGRGAIRAAHRHRVPVIFDLKDWFPVSATYYTPPVLRYLVHEAVLTLTKWNLRNSEAVTTVSPGLQQLIHERCGVDSQVIPNGVDTARFHPEDQRAWREQSLGIPPGSVVYGFHGSIEPWYDLKCLVRIFAGLSGRFHLLLVGSSLFSKYDELIKSARAFPEIDDELGLVRRPPSNIHFHRAVPYEELPQLINAMDVGLIPLAPKGWQQYALPNKFFEFTACGKHIISTPIPDMAQMGNGNVHFARTPREFSDQVEELSLYRPPVTVPAGIDWNDRVREFERLMEQVVERGI